MKFSELLNILNDGIRIEIEFNGKNFEMLSKFIALDTLSDKLLNKEVVSVDYNTFHKVLKVKI